MYKRTFSIISFSIFSFVALHAYSADFDIHCNGEFNAGCCTAISGGLNGATYTWSANRGATMSPAVTVGINYTEMHCPGFVFNSIRMINSVDKLRGEGFTTYCRTASASGFFN